MRLRPNGPTDVYPHSTVQCLGRIDSDLLVTQLTEAAPEFSQVSPTCDGQSDLILQNPRGATVQRP